VQQALDLNASPRSSSNIQREFRNMNSSQQNPMKRSFFPILTVVLAMTFLTGCAWQIGGDKKVTAPQPTTGQQLIDLQKARDSGAITDSEFQAQKTKVLGGK
jgi:Short C-terminal domain